MSGPTDKAPAPGPAITMATLEPAVRQMLEATNAEDREASRDGLITSRPPARAWRAVTWSGCLG